MSHLHEKTPGDGDALNNEVLAAWNDNAEFWDGRMGEGNDFHKILVEPAQLRLLAVKPGETLLDIACGNGQFARRVAQEGARVTACDFSERMIEMARRRAVAGEPVIDYRVIDATYEAQLCGLGERCFDAAVCTMALMDMAELAPLAAALVRLLKPGGRFVFSLCHPCFNSGRIGLAAESMDEADGPRMTHWVKVSRYSQAFSHRGVAMVGQPTPHLYFHRPLGVLMAPFFNAGLVMDGLEEPAFGDRAEAGDFFQAVYAEIPPVLAVRLRLPG